MATARCLDFVVTGGTGEVPQRVAAALAPRFRVAAESRRHVRQVWLDTFDWRLHAAGLVLRQVTGPGHAELELSTPGGETVLSQPLAAGPAPPRGAPRPARTPRRPRWPGRLAVIPEGPLRDRLGPVIEVRALLPLARAEGTVTRLRVLDAEQKTVARVTVDVAALAQPGTVPLPPRLLVSPIPGYEADARRAARLLGAADGFAPDGRPAFLAVLDAAGRRPGDRPGQPGLALRAPAPARQALAAVLLGLADTAQANVGFVLRDVDTEFLHDLRVAVRRTRSALKLAGDVLPRGVAARFTPEFKWLGDLTTPTRDLDVHLSGFGEMAAGLAAAAPADLEPFRAYLARRRTAERRKLARGLRSARFGQLMIDWRAALEAAGKPGRTGRARSGAPASGPPGLDVASLAAARIGRAYQRVASHGSAIAAAGPTGGLPAEELHDLRKRGKELRYLLEFFGSLYDPAALHQAVKDLKGLQDCLGGFQDAAVQRAAIRAFAAQLTGERRAGGGLTAPQRAATLLALGEVTAQLHARQDRARAELASRFAEFTRAGTARTLGILPPAGGA